jgi:DNA invertase Pin-like site-specific DNA recombinase
MRRAKLEGRHIGRAPLDFDRQAVLRDRNRGMSLTEIATAHNISRATVSRVIKEAREATSPKGCIPAPLQLHENRLPDSAA